MTDITDELILQWAAISGVSAKAPHDVQALKRFAMLVIDCQPALEVRIEHLFTSNRILNCLKGDGIYRISDLLNRTDSELARIPNLGQKSRKEIKEILAARGLFLRDSSESYSRRTNPTGSKE